MKDRLFGRQARADETEQIICTESNNCDRNLFFYGYCNTASSSREPTEQFPLINTLKSPALELSPRILTLAPKGHPSPRLLELSPVIPFV